VNGLHHRSFSVVARGDSQRSLTHYEGGGSPDISSLHLPPITMVLGGGGHGGQGPGIDFDTLAHSVFLGSSLVPEQTRGEVARLDNVSTVSLSSPSTTLRFFSWYVPNAAKSK
jgi:hypothetical protein